MIPTDVAESLDAIVLFMRRYFPPERVRQSSREWLIGMMRRWRELPASLPRPRRLIVPEALPPAMAEGILEEAARKRLDPDLYLAFMTQLIRLEVRVINWTGGLMLDQVQEESLLAAIEHLSG